MLNFFRITASTQNRGGGGKIGTGNFVFTVQGIVVISKGIDPDVDITGIEQLDIIFLIFYILFLHAIHKIGKIKNMHIILDRTIAHVLRLFYATGCHFTDPIALRHSLSTALPYLILQYHF